VRDRTAKAGPPRANGEVYVAAILGESAAVESAESYVHIAIESKRGSGQPITIDKLFRGREANSRPDATDSATTPIQPPTRLDYPHRRVRVTRYSDGAHAATRGIDASIEVADQVRARAVVVVEQDEARRSETKRSVAARVDSAAPPQVRVTAHDLDVRLVLAEIFRGSVGGTIVHYDKDAFGGIIVVKALQARLREL